MFFLRLISILFKLFFVAVSAYFLLELWEDYASQNYAVKNYQPISGYIAKSSVIDYRVGGHTKHRPEVIYSYKVSGQQYQSEKYSHFRSWLSKTEHNNRIYSERVVASNPPGKNITVFYDPKNPSEAILNMDYITSTAHYLTGGVFLCVWLFLTGMLTFKELKRLGKG